MIGPSGQVSRAIFLIILGAVAAFAPHGTGIFLAIVALAFAANGIRQYSQYLGMNDLSMCSRKLARSLSDELVGFFGICFLVGYLVASILKVAPTVLRLLHGFVNWMGDF